jgi:hypothetical protein
MISNVFTAREIPLLAAVPLISHLAAKDTSACGGEKTAKKWLVQVVLGGLHLRLPLSQGTDCRGLGIR